MNPEGGREAPRLWTMPEVKKRESQERREGLLEKAHRRAATRLEFERYLSREERPTFQDFLQTHPDIDTVFTPEEKDVMQTILLKYSAERQNTYRVFNRVIDTIGEVDGENDEAFAERTGTTIATMRSKWYVPSGRILAHEKEGYIILSCELQEDYDKLHGGDEQQLQHNATYHHAFSLTFQRAEDADPETGDVPAFDDVERVPVLLVNGLETSSKGTTIKHERQHFINWHTFMGPEARAGLTKEQQAEVAMRDELLAMLRGGDSIATITTWMGLDDGSYGWMVSEERGDPKLRQVREQIFSALNYYGDKFSSSWGRDMLVQHLLATPLSKFPKRIESLFAFYGVRESRVNDRLEELRIPDEEGPYPLHMVPAEYRTDAVALFDAYEDFEAAHRAKAGAIFGTVGPENVVTHVRKYSDKYFALREKFLLKTGLPRKIDLEKAKEPPPLSPF